MEKQFAYPGTEDCLSALQDAVLALEDGDTLVLEAGVYHLYPSSCIHKFYYVSNNDSGSKKIALPFFEKRNVTLDGGGARLVIHGRISPFVIDRCEGVTIRNLTIVYSDRFYFQAKILEKEGSSLLLKPIEGSRYDLRDGIFRLLGENWENVFNDKAVLVQEFDGERRCVAYQSPVILCRLSDSVRTDMPLGFYDFRMTQRADGTIRLTGNTDEWFTAGNDLIFSAEGRMNDVFFATASKDILIQDVNILRAPGMGVIAQLCENVTLERLCIRLEEGDRGFVTTDADATHFVHCSGLVRLKDCVLENMMDDASNIHGIYTTVAEVRENTVIAELGHYQQFGINSFQPGDLAVVWRGKTTSERRRVRVLSSELIEANFIKLEVEDASGVAVGDLLENPDRMPEVLIQGCRTGNNRPRGFIVSTNRPAVVEGCTFYNSECGVAAYGYMDFWFESGGVRDLTVRDNTFLDCCYGCKEEGGAIVLKPEAVQEDRDRFFHHNLKVYGNTFRTFYGCAVEAKGVEGIDYHDNTFVPTENYPRYECEEVRSRDCRNVFVNGEKRA